MAPGFTGGLIFFGESRVEHSAKLHITRMASGCKNYAPHGPDMHLLALET